MPNKIKTPKPELLLSNLNRNAKRKTLGKITLGSSMIWMTPVIESVLLPANAQTSPGENNSPTTSLSDPCSLEIIDGTLPWTYSVSVTGQIVGIGNAGITVNISVATGGQNFATTAVSNGSGAYGPVVFGVFDTCIDAGNPMVSVTSASFSGTATCTIAHGKTCLDAQFSDICNTEIVADISSPTTYSARVSGQVNGLDNAGRSIDITATTGGQTFNTTVVTNGSGVYGPVDLGVFNITIDNSNPTITAESTEFPGSAMCTLIHGK